MPAFVAPYDILERSKKNINVVQPDLMVICDLEEKLGKDGYYKGVPALGPWRSSPKGPGIRTK